MVSVRRHESHWRAYLARGRLGLASPLGLGLLAVVGVVLAATLFIRTSEAFHACYCQHKHDNRYSDIYSRQTIALVRSISRVSLHFACTEDALNKDSGGLTALFTIVLAITGAAQWGAIRRQADIAERARADSENARGVDAERLYASLETAKKAADATALSADAVVGVEAARLEVYSTSIPKIRQVHASGVTAEWYVFVRFVNNGRTKAQVVERCISFHHGWPFPPHNMRFPHSSVKRAQLGDYVGPDKVDEMRISLATIENDAAFEVSPHLWVRGYIAYRDYLDSYWRSEFLFKYNPRSGHFDVGTGEVSRGNWRYRYNPVAPDNHIAPNPLLETLLAKLTTPDDGEDSSEP